MRKKHLLWTAIVLIGAGIFLWSINWWANRPLFIDEANIARNLYDRSFGGLFSPLDHRQYAPPLYLVMAKMCGTLFSYGERSLRIPAMIGGLLTIYGLLVASRSLKLGWWTLLPLALLFANPSVLRYVGEVKPYAIDMGVAAILLGYGLKSFQAGWKWAAIGAIAVWLSLPAVFILAAIGSYHLLCTCAPPPKAPEAAARASLRALLMTIGVWLISFGLLYFSLLQPSVGSRYLAVYHSPYFFPLPGSEGFWEQATNLIQVFPKLAFGYTAVAIVTGATVLLLAVTVYRARVNGWLLLPIGLVLVASMFGYYSLIPRLLLFTLPAWWILAAQVSKTVFEASPPLLKPLVVGLWLLIAGGTNVLRHFTTPEVYSNARALAWEIDPAYQPVLHHGVLPTFDYYRRIHPAGPQTLDIPPISSFQTIQKPGKFVLLYDVLTQGNIRISAQQDSSRAAERGCQVRVQPYFRAKAIYVDCEETPDR